MADKFQREILISDLLLLKLVQKKRELVEKGRAIARAMEDVAKQHQKLVDEHNEAMTTVNNLKLDIIKRVQKLSRGLVGEFELPVTTELRDGQVALIVTDGLEEFKDSFKSFDKWRQAVPRKKNEALADKQ
jgi:hypothetical protein